MAYTEINDPSKFFQVTAYTGGSNPETITNGGNSDLQPDWIWHKRRDSAASHYVLDSSRGVNSTVFTDTDAAQDTATGYFASFDSDGFTTGSDSAMSFSGRTYVAWQWKCNAGTTTSFNESGNNPGGTRQTNTTAGFSIITSTGTGATGTIAHGLGAVPHWWLSKQLSNAENWAVYHKSNTSAPETEILSLNLDAATADNANAYNDTAPTSTNLTVHTKNEVNTDARTYVHYVFTEKQGFSKFGSYIGNGSANGPFTNLGFKPAFLMIKPSSAQSNWFIVDNQREPINPVGKKFLLADHNQAAATSDKHIDFLSNGFKCRDATGYHNDDNVLYLYMAFAEHPFVSSSGTPTTGKN